jgi:flagellar hook assembly protein FlgD
LSLTARVAFLLLVVASFGAFFVAQRLKSEDAVIAAFKRDREFSPTGNGHKDRARIRFRVRDADDITVEVVDDAGRPVKRLVDGRRAEPGRRVRLQWDGTTEAGGRAPDGLYHVRIGLRRQGRSVVPPLGIRLDTQPPSPAVIRTDPPTVAPGEPVRVRIRGAGPRAVPRFRVLDTTADPPRTVAEFQGRRGVREAEWDGRDADGEPAGPGTYLIAVGVRDRAGNFGWGPRLPPRSGAIEGRPGVTIRALAVQPPVTPVRAGRFVTFRVDARRRPWSWSIRRIGEPRPRVRSRRDRTSTAVNVRAPGEASGVYLFEAQSGRHRAAVPFAVQGEEPAPLLVVLPAISWLGTQASDDPAEADGIPNTLDRGQSVPLRRALEGLPEGFADAAARGSATTSRPISRWRARGRARVPTGPGSSSPARRAG